MRFLSTIFALFLGAMITMVAANPIDMDNSVSANAQELVKHELSKRILKLPPLCRVSGLGGEAYYRDVESSADYLRKNHNSGIDCFVEKGLCGQVACIGTSQVLLCSEVNHDMTVSCADVANAVLAIDKDCTRASNWLAPLWRVTQGQIFDTLGWNVVVREKAGSC